MKLTFLGTSAGEEYPGIWCDCENCAKARKWGGKNIRRNSSVMIDGDIMIDIGKTAHIQAERFGLNLRSVETLLVTHTHKDHLDLHTIWARQMPPDYESLPSEQIKNLSSPRFSALPNMNVFGSSQVENAIKSDKKTNFYILGINFTVVEPFQEYKSGDAVIYTLDGKHGDGDGRSINYIVTRKNRTFLYLSDTGYPFDETLETLRRYKYDFIITEGTFGTADIEPRGHLGLDANVQLLNFFNENNLWKGQPEYYLTHLAPHWCPPYDEYKPVVEEKGLKLAYDGLVLEYPYI